jgi:hypothetical protein
MASDLSGKYLSMEGVFQVENQILDNVGVSIASAQQRANTSTYLYWWITDVLMYLRNE